MGKDYFDRVCEDPSTIIEEEVCLVIDLWKHRLSLIDGRKRRRLRWFFNAFKDMMEKLNEGHVFTLDDMKKTEYWEYISGYHSSWGRSPRTEKIERQMVRKFEDSIYLFHDIQKRGMIDPLAVIVKNGRKVLYRGYRRLVILHTLGTKEARVRYAIVNSGINS